MNAPRLTELTPFKAASDVFENPSAEHVFRDDKGKYKHGPASIISKAFVAELHPPEFKVKVQQELDMRRPSWKDKPDDVFDVVRNAVVD